MRLRRRRAATKESGSWSPSFLDSFDALRRARDGAGLRLVKKDGHGGFGLRFAIVATMITGFGAGNRTGAR